jgi:hypothetical protein
MCIGLAKLVFLFILVDYPMHERAGERNLVILVILVELSIMRPSMCIGLAKLVFLLILVELSDA